MSLLPFDPRPIITIVMGVVLLVWVIVCAVLFARAARRSMVATGRMGRVRCERCGTEYEVGIGDLTRMGFSKSASITKTRREGAALVDEPNYTRYAKRLLCPHCGKRAWAQVLNIAELQDTMRAGFVKAGITYLLLMVAGGALVLAVTGIAMDIAQAWVVAQLQGLQ